jgi:hypothetical protein
MHAPLTDLAITVQAFGLFYGSARAPLVVVAPDLARPGMYRVVWPEGASDIANLSRARDAAFVHAEVFPTTTEMRGRVIPCVRIRSPKQGEVSATKRPDKPPPSNEMDDEIPF